MVKSRKQRQNQKRTRKERNRRTTVTRKQRGAGFFDWFKSSSPAPVAPSAPGMPVAAKNMPVNTVAVPTAVSPSVAPTRSWRNRARGAWGNVKTQAAAVRNGFRSNTFRKALNQM